MPKIRLKSLPDEVRPLAMLAEINQALTVAQSPRAGLQRALEILDNDYGVIRSAVVLSDPDSGRLRVWASAGVPGEGRHAEWEMGEGITGRVVASGQPVVVPQISQEPEFLHRTGRRPKGVRSEITFLCVPIPGATKAIGSLNIDFPFDAKRPYDRDLHVCRVVASMFGQAIRLKEAAEAERQRLLDENIHLKAELKERYDFAQIIGTSGPMRQVYEQITQVAATNTTVLIRGESGTGKELIAHAIHYNSTRAKKPFIKVSCAALPDSLIEAELFGHEKGAFTGAAARKKGAGSNWPRAARCSWTKSATSTCPRRSSCSACCRKRSSSGSGASSQSVRTCGSSRPPTRISRKRSPAARSARISTTGSMSSPYSCRRCGNGKPTSSS